MKWFTELPQEPGYYLWWQVDLSCDPVEVVTVRPLSDWREPLIPQLGKSEAGKNGGSYRYKSVQNEELVMCFGLDAPFVGPNGPEVDAWCRFTYPDYDYMRKEPNKEGQPIWQESWKGVII